MRERACPVCRKHIPAVDLDAPFRPFCSPRCRTVDLGSWLDERHKIPGQPDGDAPTDETLDAGRAHVTRTGPKR